MIKRTIKRLSSLARRKLRFAGVNIPIVIIMIAGLSILPIGMAFGEGESEPAGRNLLDPENPLIEVYYAGFHPGTPTDEEPPIPNLQYTDSTPIKNGNYWLSFNWRMLDLEGEVGYGDYFDVVLDLGLDSIAAEVSAQLGTFAPVIYTPYGTTAGTISWINEGYYQNDKRIVIRIELNAQDFAGLSGDGTEDGRVAGTGVWGFQYKAGQDAGGDKIVYWEISNGDNPIGTTPVGPEPPTGPDVPPGGNPNFNPYDDHETGYNKVGGRMTPDSTPVGETIFYWTVQINGHKHATLEEWAACPNNHDNNPYNDDPPPPNQETFTIVDTGTNISPTWLRNITEVNGKPVIHPGTALTVNRNGGLYGQQLSETTGSAYMKLYYVNSEYIWQDRIDYEGSLYKTPANDPNQSHAPSTGHPVGSYDPYYTTWYLKAGERNAVMYAPNYLDAGGAHAGYLTPVPAQDIRAIRMTQNGFEIDMVTNAILGKTLAIAYMAMPATDSSGNYNNSVGNTVSIVGVNDGGPVAGASGAVLIGGTISGSPLPSPNKGKFIIDKYDYNTAAKLADVVFSVTAQSEDEALQTAANELIAAQKENSDPPGSLRTGSNGRLAIDLPPLPWAGGKPLTLTITETAPEGHFAVNPFTVVIEPENGTVVSLTPGAGEARFVQLAPDQFGVYVWDRSKELDLSVYDAALLKWIKKVDRKINDEWVPVYYKNEYNLDIVSVKNGDVVLYRIDLFNHCHNALWITEVEDELPPGLIFDPAATIAHIDEGSPPYNNDLWELVEGSSDPVKIRYIGPPIPFEPWNGVIGDYPEWRLPLVLKVDIPDTVDDGTLLRNFAIIKEMKNSDGEDVTEYDPTPENNYDDAYVTPNNEIVLACEVDKDTIRRTSAAYVSPPDREGFDNILASETYRYNVDFRSTSNIAADEYTLDDPLENINHGQVRLEMLVTPVVWGDVDGKYNLWYKTNKTNDNQVYSDVKATTDDVEQRWPNKGFKLWAAGLSTTDRKKLDVGALGLGSDEYITALRFEYGAVLVGFTSKNYGSVSLNGEHRNSDGDLTLPADDLKKLDGYAPKEIKALATPAAASAASTATEEPKEGNFITRLFSGIFGSSDNDESASSAMAAGTVVETSPAPSPAINVFEAVAPGDVVDWTPDPARPDFSAGALNAEGLAPVSYLVSAEHAMEEERIVTSAKSMIAKGELWDNDVDAVVTLQIKTFMLEPEEGTGLTRLSTFEDEVPMLAPNALPGETTSRTPRTFDEMKPLLWIVTAFAAAFCALLLMRLYNMRKKRILLAQKRRRYAR